VIGSPVTPSISIGCQQGGPEGGYFAALKVPLYRLLCKHVTSTHCPAIDEYALVLRIDGAIDKFGEEGITRLRFAKARRYITCDVQVPERTWRPMTERQTKQYLADSVKSALAACATRLSREGAEVNGTALQLEVDAAIADYLSSSNSR
jgi:hypothetical protein